MPHQTGSVRALLRWTAAAFACLAVFAATWWAWEALDLPPAGADRLGVALAVAAVLSAVAGLPTAAWASRDRGVEQPRGYFSRLSDRGPEEVFPVRPGKWLIGRDRDSCDVIVPHEFGAAGGKHANLACDDAGFWIEGLHQNGTYLQDKLIPANEPQPVAFGQAISLAGPRGSKPERCTFMLTARPLPWPRPTPTDEDTTSQTVAVLALLADPAHGSRLALDLELRTIHTAVSAAKNSGQVLLKPSMAPSLSDLSLELYEFRPTVLHISGVGSRDGKECGIALPADGSANAQSASPVELSDFFRSKAPTVRCVVLSACYERAQGLALARQVACVIGTPPSSSEDAALTFTEILYRGLTDGMPVGAAFARGKRAINRRAAPDGDAVPVIHAQHGTRRQCLT